jgi:hypothetical protein
MDVLKVKPCNQRSWLFHHSFTREGARLSWGMLQAYCPGLIIRPIIVAGPRVLMGRRNVYKHLMFDKILFVYNGQSKICPLIILFLRS